eukprot:GHVO01017427.1.p1 GENE.GHVO01017427.1~~GHVO01017427.1.p1  ORF type:complete len:395 (+),score=58.56 GHVO01017427.1:182-1366(+)
MNHARLQDEAGCCVQLRGNGISSPGTPGADEPIHLWVKHDHPSQLQTVQRVLEEIISSSSCTTEKAPYMPPQKSPPVALPPKPLTPPSILIEYMWTLHYICHAENPVYVETLSHQYADFYRFQMTPENFFPRDLPLAESLSQFPNILRLMPTDDGKLLATSMHRPNTTWGDFCAKHAELRPKPGGARNIPMPIHKPTSQSPPIPNGRVDIPLSPANLLIQALHKLVSENHMMNINHIEAAFASRWGIEFDYSFFESKNMLGVISSVPQIIRIVHSDMNDPLAAALPDPNFKTLKFDEVAVDMDVEMGHPPTVASAPPAPRTDPLQTHMEQLMAAATGVSNVITTGTVPPKSDHLRYVEEIRTARDMLHADPSVLTPTLMQRLMHIIQTVHRDAQ